MTAVAAFLDGKVPNENEAVLTLHRAMDTG